MTGTELGGILISNAMTTLGLALSFLIPFAIGVAFTINKKGNSS